MHFSPIFEDILMKTTNDSKSQYSLANLLLLSYYVLGALIVLTLCLSSGEPGVALGALAVFGLQGLVVAFSGPEKDPSPYMLRRHALVGRARAVPAKVRPARELATRSNCWSFWPKSSAGMPSAKRSMCWSFWPQNGHTQEFAR